MSGTSPSWLHDDAPAAAPAASSSAAATVSIPLPNAAAAPNTVTDAAPAAASSKSSNSNNDPQWWKQEWRLIIITAIILVAMNIGILRWAMYPFVLMSTWVHEMCHGVAALMVGGQIVSLQVFVDGSGLATYRTSGGGDFATGFVSSAGYQGTCVAGYLLLLVRKQRHAARIGPILLGTLMILSVLLYVRNPFGMLVVLVEGGLLIFAGLILRSRWARNLFLVLAITLTLNSITSVTILFRASHSVNGNPVDSDAVSVAEDWFGFSLMWALIWLGVGLLLAALGVRFPLQGPNKVAEPYLKIPGCAKYGGEEVAPGSAADYVAGNSNVNAARASNNSTGGSMAV